jgi:WD40 repeat protein
MRRLLTRMTSVRVDAGVLLLIGLAALVAPGCSAEPPAAPSAPATGSATAATESRSETSAGATSTGAESAPAASGGASAEPQNPAGTPAGGQTAAATKPAAARKPAAVPSPSQLEKWGLSDDPWLQLLACADGFSDYPQCLAVSPDGKRFALGGGKLTLWNTTESKPAADLLADLQESDLKRPILSAAFSPNGEWLAAGDNGGKLHLWKVSEPNERKTYPAHEGRLTQLAISPDSATIATTSYSGEVRLWKADDGSRLKTLKVDSQEIHRLAFLSDSLLACAGRDTTVWNLESGEKSATLTKQRVIGSALSVSPDRKWLAFADHEGHTQLWDVEKNAAAGQPLLGSGAHRIAFSHDGQRIATYSGDSNIRIWDAAARRIVQVIDADGGRTVGLAWLPESRALLVASEAGRVRLWGTAETAGSLGIELLKQPELKLIAADAKKPFSPAQFDAIIDVRSFPRLPEALPGWSFGGMDSYNAPVAQPEAELFYRYTLGKAGWVENEVADPSSPGLNFRKEGCVLNVSFAPATPVPGQTARPGDQQIGLRFAGNYDVRWLPKVSEFKSKNSFSSFSMVMYRTKAPLTEVETAIIKQFHAAGWTPYTRLAASSAEDPASRSLSMLQGGCVLTVSIGPPADAPGELAVMAGVNVTRKALPIPPDSGWIEFDNSTEIQLVANTKMDLGRTIAFYDEEMAAAGWLAREAGRHVDEKERKAWLPYIRGQRDVLIRLAALPDDQSAIARTRVVVGDAERSSWQLEKPRSAEAAAAQPGIQAADFQLPKGAAAVRFDVDEKNIEFEISGPTPPQLAEQFAKQMEALDWKRDGAGVISDEYSFVTYKQGKAEIQLRARSAMNKTTAMISGDGLLWSKPLPTAPVRISYETWLRRNRKTASLDHLDEFASEMQKIPAGSGTGK